MPKARAIKAEGAPDNEDAYGVCMNDTDRAQVDEEPADDNDAADGDADDPSKVRRRLHA